MSQELPDDYLGATARVASGPAPELIATGYALETADAPLLHRGLGLADLAHVQTLLDLGAVPRGAAVALTRELLQILDTPAGEFPYDARYGDAYNSREKELQRRIGSDAGWLHLGRTRREAGRIAFRIALRHALLDLHASLCALTGALTDLARQHAATVWADTTYLQPAQPSTFGHYLGAFAEETSRHLDRVRAAFAWTNRSPTGTGGVSGSAILVNREHDAADLGFAEPGFHTRDIMWSVDGLVDVVLSATQAATTLDRLCEDLEIFASPAFGYVELAGSLCRASVLLPQKRNPYALAVVRSGASVLIGRTTGLLVAQRSPSARTDNWLHAYGETASAVAAATRLVALGAAVVRTLQVREEVLLAAAGQHFTGAADLAEHLVGLWGLDYRSAYQVVGRAVADATTRDEPVLTPERLEAAANELLGRGERSLPELALVTGDPQRLAHSRDVLGGSAPHRVGEHADRVDVIVHDAVAWERNARTSLRHSEDAVVSRATQLAGS